MNISKRVENSQFNIININGHVDATNAPQLEKEFDSIISDGGSKIIVNFRDVEYISSAGLRVLLSVTQRLKSKDGDLRLCEMNPTVEKTFNLAGFTRLFDIFKSEQESLAN
ncbi:STAS domain-containing protein [candidate division KSB1 bacterium]|nr:STAS domain-containing protein [candidate division KSB1 bacterium]